MVQGPIHPQRKSGYSKWPTGFQHSQTTFAIFAGAAHRARPNSMLILYEIFSMPISHFLVQQPSVVQQKLKNGRQGVSNFLTRENVPEKKLIIFIHPPPSPGQHRSVFVD